MKSRLFRKVCAYLSTFGMIASADAGLVGRLPDSNGVFQAVYDSGKQITWLADANAIAGSEFDDGTTSQPGRVTWASALAWAANLMVGGVTDWRLPTTSQPDASCSIQNDDGGSGTGCTGSEMGHLFNVEGVTAAAPGPFINVQAFSYWSSTPYSRDEAWLFRFDIGWQVRGGGQTFAWAVTDGDPFAPIPIPAAAWLLGSGLLGMIGIARRRKAA